jgi:deoxyhypusine synthase
MADAYFKRKVEAIEVKEKTISQLLAEMAKTAYQGRKLGEAVEVWETCLKRRI